MRETFTADKSPLRAAIDATERFGRHKHHLTVAELTGEYAHSIKYRGLKEGGNCATFALGLPANAIYQSVASRFARKTVAGRAFIDWLIQHYLCELEHPILGSLVLYFRETAWRHIGIVAADGRVVSQWGTYPVYEHGVFEVPSGYGDNVRYFKMIDPADALRLFREYATTTGLSGD